MYNHFIGDITVVFFFLYYLYANLGVSQDSIDFVGYDINYFLFMILIIFFS